MQLHDKLIPLKAAQKQNWFVGGMKIKDIFFRTFHGTMSQEAVSRISFANITWIVNIFKR